MLIITQLAGFVSLLLLFFFLLRKVHTDEDIFMETGLPEKLIKKARGTVAFEEEAALVG